MPPLQFIGTGGFNQGYRGAQNRQAGQTANASNKLALENQFEDRDRRRSLDEALAAAVGANAGGIAQQPQAAASAAAPAAVEFPRSVSSAPAVPAAAATSAVTVGDNRTALGRAVTGELASRGLGREAFDAATSSAAIEAAEFDAMVEDLVSGNVEAALARAERNGMEVTPQLRSAFQNAWFQREFGRTWGVNKTLYPNDPRKLAKAQAIDTTRTLGVMQASSPAAGGIPTQPLNQFATPGRPEPTAPPPSFAPSYKPFVGSQNGQDGTFIFNERTGQHEFHPGSVMRTPSSSGSSSVFEQKRQAWLALNPGDEQGALQFASGRSQLSPAQARLAAERIANTWANGHIRKPDNAAVEQYATDVYNRIMAAGTQGEGQASPDGGVINDDPLGLFGEQ